MPIQTAQQAQNAFQGAGISTAQEGQVLAGQSSGAPASPVPSSITSAHLAPTTPVNLPPAPTPTTPTVGNPSATMASNNAVLNPPADPNAPSADPNSLSSLFSSYLGSETAPPSTADIYQKTYGVSPDQAKAQQSTAQTGLNTANQAVTGAQGKYDALQAQINGLDYQANTIVPNQDQQDATGRGITAGGLAPIDAANQRALLLQKAPLQLQALLAQADLAHAQGKATLAAGILSQANSHLDALFNAQVSDAQAQYKYRSDQLTAIYNYASSAEKDQIAAKQHAADQAFTVQQNAIANAQDLAKTAISNGQDGLAGKIVALDPTSPTYKADLAKLEGQMTQNPQDVALKNAQIAQTQASTANSRANTAKTYNDIAIAKANANGSSSTTIQDSNGQNYTVPLNVAPYISFSNSGIMYADLSTVQGTPTEKAAAVTAAQKAGIKVITNKNIALDLTNIGDANNKLDSISTIMAGIDQPSALSRDLGGLGLTKLATMAQTDPQKAAAGALSGVGLDILKAISGVQGFRGNTAVVQQITDHLPSINDTNAVAQQKISYIRQLIDDRENSILGKTGTNSTAVPNADAIKAGVPPGQIAIARNGTPGYIPASEFDPKTDKKL